MGQQMVARRKILTPVVVLLFAVFLCGCGINTIPTEEEEAKAAWSEVQNQYQRRAELIPNLVETVRGFATQEREVLTQVTEARAKATQVRSMPINSPTRKPSNAFNKPGPAFRCAWAAACGQRTLSRSQVQSELPGVAIAIGRNRKSHRRGPARLHRSRSSLQHGSSHLSGRLWAAFTAPSPWRRSPRRKKTSGRQA